MKKPGALLVAAAAGAAVVLFTPTTATATNMTSPVVARVSGTPKAVNGAKFTVRLRAGIRRIPERAEQPSGYERSRFKLWDDTDHDCQDTRSEVLRQESERRVTGTCAARTGLWFSYYDHTQFTRASKLDIDHLVPLAEVWRSGGRSWSAAKREAYANDLTDRRTLVAVSAHANRSKGDRDPAEWLPDYRKCKYVRSWVDVKLRWGLSADPAEKAALKDVAAGCPNSRITVHKAKIRTIAAPTKHHHGGSQSGGGGGGGTSHACTRTSTGSCISGGQFCPQASYGHVGYDAHGNAYICTGDRSHPHWE